MLDGLREGVYLACTVEYGYPRNFLLFSHATILAQDFARGLTVTHASGRNGEAHDEYQTYRTKVLTKTHRPLGSAQNTILMHARMQDSHQVHPKITSTLPEQPLNITTETSLPYNNSQHVSHPSLTEALKKPSIPETLPYTPT